MWVKILIIFCSIHRIIGCTISEISTPKIGIAKSPIWDDDTQSLYFINLKPTGEESSLYRYSLIDDHLYSAHVPGVKSTDFIIPVRQCGRKCKNLFAIGSDHDVKLVEWDGISTSSQIVQQRLFSLEPNDASSTVDYARADRFGRYYGGTYSKFELCSGSSNKSFYRESSDAGVQRIFGGLHGTAGIAFNENAHKMYHVGLCSLIISEFDWDPSTGDLCNGRVAFDFKSIGIDPSTLLGLEVDSEGNVYTANYRNSVYIINPRTKRMVREIDMGVTGVSGVAFGVPKRDILFVTAVKTILDLFTSEPIQTVTNGSSLYKVTCLGVHGANPTSLNISTKISV